MAGFSLEEADADKRSKEPNSSSREPKKEGAYEGRLILLMITLILRQAKTEMGN